MKIIYLVCILLLLLAFQSEKQYSMKFTQPEILLLINVVDQSNAPHTQVKQVQELFNRELKQHIDSTGRLK